MGVIIYPDGQRAVEVVRDRPSVVVVQRPQPVTIASGGLQGPPGRDGASGEGQLPVIDFAHGDASSVVLVLPSAGPAEVLLVSLEIEEAFNGAGPTLRVGTGAQPSLLMGQDQNDPAVVATYEVAPRVELPASTQLVLSIAPGVGSTQGRGRLTVQIAPVT